MPAARFSLPRSGPDGWGSVGDDGTVPQPTDDQGLPDTNILVIMTLVVP
jgi:hypothetical protein